ncbi:Trichothecene C-3 esterase [Lachnellula suecica]|uniref:Trichothecene C-3 esterase n=1 Tax=Lachnellula suecica TaxID=602035 RepID=A0A8T9CGA8_9HELO|nr:Trichothecene C-3 esterase [Lachnellula suecica]
MHFLTIFTLASSLLTTQSSAAVLKTPRGGCGLNSLLGRDANAQLPLPSQDPFFVPPANWKTYKPGVALKSRGSAYPSITIGNCMDTFQVMYRSTDSMGNATWGTTTVFIPASNKNCDKTHQSKCAHAIVSYELPYDSCDPDTGPSYELQFGEPYGDMYDMLTAGYFVSVPDFEGPLASYGAGVQAGHSVLDSLQAVLSVASTYGFRTTDAKSALWGYSGGALATGFAAELAEVYAPNLALSAVVHGGLVPNVIDSGAQISNTTGFAGLVIAGILGITSQHTEARAYINSRLKSAPPNNAASFYTATTMSGSQLISAFPNTDVVDFFIGGATDLGSPILLNMYEIDALLGYHGTPNMPVFIYEAVNDELSAIKNLDSLVAGYCKQGANILYHRNSVGGHNDELFAGRPRVLQYLSTIFDDTNAISIPSSGCQTKNVTITCSVTLKNTTAVEGSKTVPYRAVVVTQLKLDVMADGTVMVEDDQGLPSGPLDMKSLRKTWSSSLNDFQFNVSGARNPLDSFSLLIDDSSF